MSESVVVCGSYEGGVHGWILKSDQVYSEVPELRFSFVGHDKVVRTVTTLSVAKRRLLVTGGDDEILRIYNLQTFRQIGEVGVRRGTITVLRFCGEKHVLCGCGDGSILMYRITDWECVHILGGHKAAIKGLAVHPSSRIALSTASDRTLRLWDLTHGRAAFITRTKGSAELVKWSSDGSHYALVLAGTIEMRLTHQEKATATNPTISLSHQSVVLDFALTSIHCISADSSGALRLWSTETGHIIWTRLRRGLARIKSLDFHCHSNSTHNNHDLSKNALLAATSDGHLEVWPLSSSDSLQHESPSVLAHVGTRLTCLTILGNFASESTLSSVVSSARNDIDNRQEPTEIISYSPDSRPDHVPTQTKKSGSHQKRHDSDLQKAMVPTNSHFSQRPPQKRRLDDNNNNSMPQLDSKYDDSSAASAVKARASRLKRKLQRKLQLMSE